MNPFREVTVTVTEEGSSSSGSNRCHESQQPSPFLIKSYDLVDDPSTDHIISWSQETISSSSGSSFVIWDPRTFCQSILPKYFKHNNFSNFIRQLNSYGFKKVNPDRWEFANVGFIRGHRHLMKNNMKRRTQQDSCQKLEEPGFDKEIHKLRRERQLLMTELVKLRHAQKTTRGYIRSMEQRLRKTELKQQQTTKLLARAVRNPEFMQRLSRTKVMMSEGSESGASGLCSFTENELEEYVDICEFEVLDLDMDMSFVVPDRERGGGGGEKEAQDQLVGEFLNDWIKEELRVVDVVEEDEYRVHVNMFSLEVPNEKGGSSK